MCNHPQGQKILCCLSVPYAGVFRDQAQGPGKAEGGQGRESPTADGTHGDRSEPAPARLTYDMLAQQVMESQAWIPEALPILHPGIT